MVLAQIMQVFRLKQCQWCCSVRDCKEGAHSTEHPLTNFAGFCRFLNSSHVVLGSTNSLLFATTAIQRANCCGTNLVWAKLLSVWTWLLAWCLQCAGLKVNTQFIITFNQKPNMKWHCSAGGRNADTRRELLIVTNHWIFSQLMMKGGLTDKLVTKWDTFIETIFKRGVGHKLRRDFSKTLVSLSRFTAANWGSVVKTTRYKLRFSVWRHWRQ